MILEASLRFEGVTTIILTNVRNLLTNVRNLLQQRVCSQLAQIVRRQRGVARQHVPIAVRLTGDAFVEQLDAVLAEFLTYEPRHLTGDVSNVYVRSLIERVGENDNLVPFVDGLAALRCPDLGRDHAGRTMAKGNEEPLVLVGPAQNTANRLREWNIVHDAVTTGNEDPDVWGLLGEAVAPDFFQIERLAKLLLVLLVDIFDSIILLRESPHLELHGIARQCGNVDVEAGGVQVQDREQHFNGVIPGRKKFAAIHAQVALLGCNEEDLPFAARVAVGVVGTVEIRL